VGGEHEGVDGAVRAVRELRRPVVAEPRAIVVRRVVHQRAPLNLRRRTGPPHTVY